jgi:hypothetical protein
MEGSINSEKKEKNCHILPLFFPPPVCSYLHHAIPLSIILSNPHSIEWFYCNYLQTCNLLDNRPYPNEYFQFFPHNFNWEGSYFLDVQWWQYDNTDEIIDFCRYWIKKGFYLDFDIWEADLPGTRGYGKFKVTHQCLIYGYDDEKKEFYSINFDPKLTFCIIKHTYADFIKAFKSVCVYLKETKQYLKEEYTLRILKPQDREYNLEIPVLKQIFLDYLNSYNSAKKHYYANYFEKKRYTKWGVDVVSYLIDYIENNNRRKIDYRAFHGLWEHKVIMADRVTYLTQKNMIKADDVILQEFHKIVTLAKAVRLLIIKYNITFEKNLLTKVFTNLKDIFTIEKQSIESVIQMLE